MKSLKVVVLAGLCAVPALLMLGDDKTEKTQPATATARGKYHVTAAGCNDCHTPLKMTDRGPVPDMTRMLSGHPEYLKLPPPDLKPGPWFAATAGMTAWTGP